MTERDSKGVLEAATEARSLRRRDHLLPLMVERQKHGRIADQARIVLARHHHAVADLDPLISQPESMAAFKRRMSRNDRNIDRIRSTQQGPETGMRPAGFSAAAAGRSRVGPQFSRSSGA